MKKEKKNTQGYFVKLNAGDVEKGNEMFNQAMTPNTQGESVGEELNLREELNKIDMETCETDLLNMYEALRLTESEKRELVEKIIQKEPYEKLQSYLEEKMDTLMEAEEDIESEEEVEIEEDEEEKIKIDGTTNAIIMHSTMTDATYGFICDNDDLLKFNLKGILELPYIEDSKELEDKIDYLEWNGIHEVDSEHQTLFREEYNGEIRWFAEYRDKTYLIDNIVKYISERF